MNLVTVGQDESTSEDEEKRKPVVPPRTRLNSLDVALAAQKKHQNNKDKLKSKLFYVKFKCFTKLCYFNIYNE